jgi:hypothetical protein
MFLRPPATSKTNPREIPMTDAPQTQSDTPADDTRARNREIIFAALAEAGIHRVTVGYDGYSDSGQIDDVEAWSSSPEKIPLPSNRNVQLPSPIQTDPSVEMTLQEAIETLVYDYLEETHYGWEMRVPTARSSFRYPSAQSRSSTTTVTSRSTPAPILFDRGLNGTSLPSQPLLR